MWQNLSKRRSAKLLYSALVCAFLLIASFLRIWYLDRIPTGIVMDEFDYVLNAKFVYHTGHNMYANWSPWSLSTVPNEVPKGELTYLISLPFVGPFGLSILTARLGFAVISIASVFILYGIAYSLFGPWVGLVTGFMAAINPWSIYFGRTAFDVPISVTMYLLAFLMLLTLRGPRVLFTLVPLFLAFYNYIGTKLLLVPFTLISIFGIWYGVRKKEDTKWFGLVALGALILFSSFVLRLKSTGTNLRMDQLFHPYNSEIIRDVNDQRRLTLATPIAFVFANKGVVYIKALTEKFLGAFSPHLLFTNGEGLSTLSLWQHGLFYPIDVLFLIAGILFLFRYAPFLFGIITAIIGISTIPSVFSTVGTSYVHRSSLMYPFMTILISYGVVKSVGRIAIPLRRVALGFIFLAYLFSLANFVNLYFFRFPYYNSESFGLSQRLYSAYTVRAKEIGVPVMHITESPELYLRNYLFYSDAITSQSAPRITRQLIQKSYSWLNAEFTKTCPTKAEIDAGNTTYILSNTSPCKELFVSRPMLVIPTLSDGGTLYMIFNDRLCGEYALSSYPTGFTMDDFLVEKLPVNTFCERFIIRYSSPLYQPQTREGNWISPSL